MTAAGQNLTAEIDVESTVVVDLPPATPLSSVGPALLPLTPPSVSLETTTLNRAVGFAPTVGTSVAPEDPSAIKADSLRGYAYAGYLPVYNLAAGVGYRFVDLKDTRAGICLGYDGKAYSYRTDGQKVSPQEHLLKVGLYADHSFSQRALLSAALNYRFAEFRSVGGATFDKINDLKATVDIADPLTDSYRATASLDYFVVDRPDIQPGNVPAIPSPADVHFTLGGVYGYDFAKDSTQRVSIGADVDLLSMRGPLEGGGRADFTFDEPTLNKGLRGTVAVTPKYRFRTGLFTISAGVRLDMGIGRTNAFTAAPDVHVRWEPKRAFTAYGIATGGRRFLTMEAAMAQTGLFGLRQAPVPVYTPFDARVGFLVRPVEGSYVEVFGRFGRMQDAVFPGCFSRPDAADYTIWSLGLNAGYSIGSRFKADLAARLLPTGRHSCTPEDLDHARATFRLGVEGKPIDALCLRAAYELRYRRYRILEGGGYENCGNVNDLSAEASYLISPRLSVFASLHNLLCRQVLMPDGLYSQRLHGLVGVAYRF